jgi:FAD/FMN-containing dehydrogenase
MPQGIDDEQWIWINDGEVQNFNVDPQDGVITAIPGVIVYEMRDWSDTHGYVFSYTCVH